MPAARGRALSGRRELVAAVLLSLLVVIVEGLLVLSVIRGAQTTAEVGGTSHFLTTLANVQREVLRLQVAVVHVAHASHGELGDDLDAVKVQRAILESQLRTLRGGVAESPEAATTYAAIVAAIPEVDRDLATLAAGGDAAGAETSVAALERTTKRVYDVFEFGYFERTSGSLAAQSAIQVLLLAVAVLIAVLGSALAYVLRRRVKAEFAHAYFRLEAEVRERKEAQELLRHQAYHDALTGLPNRVAFGEQLAERLRAEPDRVAALFVDLDDFKAINDALGHAAGDEVLRVVGDRLRGALRDGDVAARLGGDEFAVLVSGSPPSTVARQVADRILEALQEPLTFAGRTVFVQASIGVATGGNEDLAADELMRNADIAMYLAKSQGKNRSETYQPAMHADVLHRLALRADLEAAVSGDGLVLHYQPIVELDSGRVTAVEALVRWVHPERGLVPPAEFIPLAETTGLIVPLGRWVLREACRQVGQWRTELGQELKVSINISPVQLKHPGVIDDVRDAIESAGLRPEDVVLEITETGVVEHGAATEVLFDLQALGVKIAMDDFGTGYSSLGHIGRLPVDIIKIDQTFIQALGVHAKETALTATIVRLAGSLQLTTVAEGVEDQAQLQRIRDLGCEAAQGYLMSRPMAADAAREFLASHPASWTLASSSRRASARAGADRLAS